MQRHSTRQRWTHLSHKKLLYVNLAHYEKSDHRIYICRDKQARFGVNLQHDSLEAISRNNVSNIILLNISGEDRIGLSADFYSLIEAADVRILDIGQSVIHNHVSQGILLQLPEQQNQAQFKWELLEQAESLGLKVKIKDISNDNYQSWVSQQGSDRFIITLLTREVSAEEIAKVTKITAEQGLNIHDIARLSGRLSLTEAVTNGTKSFKATIANLRSSDS